MNNQPCYNTLAAIKTFLTEAPAGATTYSTITLGKILLESVIDATPVIIALLNEAGQVILGNHKYQKLVTEFECHEPATLLLAVIKENLGEQWLHLCQQQGYFSDQEVRIDPGGYHYPRWFICSGTWFQETDTTNAAEIDKPYYLLLVANDVTLLKRQQEEIRLNALRALLAEEELTENLRETLAGAIHQLEVPMNLMVAALNRLQRRAENSGTDKDPLCLILQETLTNSHKALNHLRQGMSFPESQKEIATPVNLNELIHEVLTIFTYRFLATGIVVDWQPALVLPSLLGHAKRLRSMFKQLIDNAIDAMKSNRQQRELHILTRSDTEIITVTLEDTGSGIAEELRLKVFEPFFTTKKAEKRTGMGLTTVQEIVNLHAGTIYIDPDYTNGSRFILHFPRAHYRDN
jgi:nitrogen fixation negative regulator NifL